MAEFSKRLRTSIQAAEEALAHQDDPDFMDYVRKAQGPIHEAAEAGEEVRQEILRRQR
jgi:CTP-dependent riboflavin kinase